MGSPESLLQPSRSLVGGRYSVALDRPLPGAGGGLLAFAAADRASGRADLMALQLQPRRPPRARALALLSGLPPDGVLGPLALGAFPIGADEVRHFVVCVAPPGLPLSEEFRPWPEAALFAQVLRPAARALVALEKRGVTHRGVRLDNIFRGAGGREVVLGAAWAAPPASFQPAIYEPPYSAMCLPGGRGEGSIADDVYALGVVLITLALGRVPLIDLDEEAVVQRKLALGSYEALTAGEPPLSPAVADIVRGMLADLPANIHPHPTKSIIPRVRAAFPD